MATNHVGVLLRYVRRMIGERPEATADAILLERFAQHADESAFAALMHRHGPLVWGVSRRVAGHEQDAEDVFQATFLLLARKARTIRKKSSVASWLYGVAHRLALRARSDAARRRQREGRATPPSAAAPADDLTWRELRDALDDELARLPDKYRAPLLLCYFAGLTQDEAARQLGWSKRSVKDRLERGRRRLRLRLAKRGVTLTMALAGSVLAGAGAAPAGLTAMTLRAAAPFALRRSLQGVISAGALVLAEGGVPSMVAGKFSMLVVALAAALLLAGYQVSAIGDRPQPPAADGPPKSDARTAWVDAYGDPLPPGAIARLGTVRFRSGGVRSAFLPDGKTVVSVEEQHAVRLWHARTGKLLREIDTGSFSIDPQQGMALSADGKCLAVSGSIRDDIEPGWRSAARVFDVATGKDIRTIERLPRDAITAVAMTLDGKLLFTLDKNGKLCIHEVDTGAELLTHQFPRETTAAVAVSPDGSTIGVGFFIWRWQAVEEPRELPAAGRSAGHLTFAPDGTWLASCDDFGPNMQVWDVGSARLLHRLELPDHESYLYGAAAFSPDGKVLAANGVTKHRSAVHFWDSATGRLLKQLDIGGDPAFSRDGKLLVASSRVWDVVAGKELSANSEAHFANISRIVTAPANLVVTTGDDHTIRVWDAATGKHLRRVAHQHGVPGIALSHDGRRLASNGTDDAICLWDVATGKRIYRLSGHGKFGTAFRPVVFSPDDRRFLTWGADMKLRTWDARTGKAVAEQPIQLAGVRAPTDDGPHFGKEDFIVVGGAQFTPDATQLVLQVNNTCVIFDTATGKQLRSFPNEGSIQIAMAISRDGSCVLASAWDKSVQTILPDGTIQNSIPTSYPLAWWDLNAGTRRHLLMLPEQGAGPVAISPTGTQFAAASSRPGSRIRLIDAATGRESRRIEGFRGAVRSLAFMPDGKRLVSGMDDSSALVWDLAR